MPVHASPLQIGSFSWLDSKSELGLFRDLKFRCLYVAGPEAGRPVRLGWATDPFRRLEDLQSGNWKLLSLQHIVWVASDGLAKRVLVEAHRLLDKADRRIGGEWFDITRDLSISTIAVAARSTGVPIVEHETFVADIRRRKLERVASAMSQPIPTWQ